jgi:hypothetical protein
MVGPEARRPASDHKADTPSRKGVALLHRILTGSMTGALLSLALFAPSSAIAVSQSTAPSAFVRVEGAGATLLPQTLVHPSTATTIKGKVCADATAAGALDQGTAGNWSGSYSASFKDYLVGSILGETPSGNNFWTLWVNGRSSPTGGCATHLHPGDHVLWFDCQADASFNCTNNPLALSAPASVKRGRRLAVSVTQLDGAGHGKAVTAAAVSGPGVTGVTGAAGTATVIPLSTGIIALQAQKSGATPSEPVYVCVYASHPSDCGKSGSSGPAVRVFGILEQQVFGRGPRLIHGTAGPDPSGLTDVSLSLFRKAPSGRCSVYDGARGRFRAARCSDKAPAFSVGADSAWSYLFPAALPQGGYRLTAIATDGSGRQTKREIGVSVLDFGVVGGKR